MDTVSSKAGGEHLLQQQQQQQQQQQAGGMWKWQVYPGTPSRSFGHLQQQQQQQQGIMEKGGATAAAGVAQRYGNSKFGAGIALKPPPSKWDDAEKWLVNTGESPAHPQQLPLQLQQSKHTRPRAGSGSGSFSVLETSDGELSSGRLSDFAFPTVPAAAASTSSACSPPRYKRSGGTGASGRFVPVPGEESQSQSAAQVKTEVVVVARRSVRVSGEVVVPEPAGHVRGGGNLRQLEASAAAAAAAPGNSGGPGSPPPEDGAGCAGGSEALAFKDKFADPGVERAASSPTAAAAAAAAAAGAPGEAVSHRDMGTQMTPIPSQRASRCGTPGRADSPSRHNTPSRRTASLGSICLDLIELQSSHLAKLEDRQLPDGNLSSNGSALLRGTPDQGGSAHWVTKEEEDEESSKSLRQINLGEVRKNGIAARTAAWLEAEQAKYTARFKQEETRIQAWENDKRAQAEAEMKRIEVKLERMKSEANEKAMSRLVAAHRRAEEMRALAQAQRAEAAAKTATAAQRLRDTGNISQRCSCFDFSWSRP